MITTQRFSPTSNESTRTLTREPGCSQNDAARPAQPPAEPSAPAPAQPQREKSVRKQQKRSTQWTHQAPSSDSTDSSNPSAPERLPRRNCRRIKGSGRARRKRAPHRPGGSTEPARSAPSQRRDKPPQPAAEPAGGSTEELVSVMARPAQSVPPQSRHLPHARHGSQPPQELAGIGSGQTDGDPVRRLGLRLG